MSDTTDGAARIAVRENMLPGSDFGEKCRLLAELGFDGIEITTPYTLDDCDMLQSVAKETGIQPVLSSCGGACLVDARKEERERGVAMLIEQLEVCAEIGAVGVIHPPLISMKMQIGGPRPRIPDLLPVASTAQLECDLLIALYQRIAKRGEELGTCIIVEPLNRYEQWWPCTLEQGAGICRAVDSPGCKLMADFFHMHIEETDMEQAIAATADLIVNVHIADSTRKTPGTGLTDFRPGFRALKAAGYSGFLGLECGISGDDRAAELKRAADYTRELYTSA